MCDDKKGEEDMSPTTILRESKTKRIVKRCTNKMSGMSKEDWKEANKVSKRERGLSKLEYKDIYDL